MKKLIILTLLSISTFMIHSCADFWAAGVRVYKVETITFAPTYSNLIATSITVGELHVHNHNTNAIIVVLSNFVDAGGWSLGSNFIENNLLFSINSNTGTNLSISQTPGVQPDYWDIYGIGSKIHIYLPQGMTINNLDLITDTGSIDIEVDNHFKSAEIGTDTGSIDCNETFSGDSINIHTDTGSIDIDILTAKDVSILADTGRVRVFNEISATNIDVTTDTGTIELKTKSTRILNVLTETGSIELDIIDFYNSAALINVTTGTGSIDLFLNDIIDISVDALVNTGMIYNNIDFESLQQTRTSLTGDNQAKTRLIKLRAETGSISLDQY